MSDSFKAVTWNVYAPTPATVLAPILRQQLKKGVSIFLMQEAGSADITKMLRDAGLKTYSHSQWRIAWDPKVWTAVNRKALRLSQTSYYSKTVKHDVYSEAVEVILCDALGRSLDVISYHTPAHIQVSEATRPANRYQAAVESFRTLAALAKASQCRAVLFGGDDNVDENHGVGSGTSLWSAWLRPATGLIQVQAPAGTHGKRKIDDFRILPKTLVVGSGWVDFGGGDHRIHGREFTWK